MMRHRKNKSGFTLLEVLLAVALGAMIVVSMTAFLFSMAELWGVGSNERLFEKHARGVSRFIETSFQKASQRYDEAADANESLYWFNWEGDDSTRESFLSFELKESPGALIWPESPLPHIVCSLEFDEGDGLFLRWRSRLEEDFDEEPPRRTLISPFVKGVEYHYINYEEENPKWQIEETPQQEADDSYLMPERIVLKFIFKGEEIKRQLILPKVMEGTPIL
ncbi:prepilin-type N-terminal cleavage/methylation domain-containing protein [Pelagicoccus sp. SDUM812002]|uniref:prepilin-type N-terminal cleavage/methylation domain-containing protein n=1 Tax=Pelagicoccus sp. SDUM812002 TaxID=3041266 RepID=UPI00280D334E|nr:prepilin-type N-terminal cleavage/methylation domain-containing protein [Pelagicoccus sp. SDUM812002]MDQ8187344.1 prepilin-type N-terminal cleavage/methylation domain-containing protein [Pelagicoccus sp. SDUM812002]